MVEDAGESSPVAAHAVDSPVGSGIWGKKRVRTRKGVSEADRYEAVRLTIQDRDCPVDVLEVPDDVPVLVGQIPLENLDLVLNRGAAS